MPPMSQHGLSQDVVSSRDPFTFLNDLDKKRVDMILDRAMAQPEPLEDAGTFRDFLETMSKVWRIADEYNLTSDISFTNFLMFGPQSAGKTTIAERIMGFPVATVKTGIGTTRPIVLTTRHAEEEEFKVKSTSDETFHPIQKHEIMQWVRTQMAATGSVLDRPRITKDRVYIEVSGPNYMHRRFVDLPGFQCNDEDSNKGTRQDILDLLRKEMENPDTVVVCVEDARQDFANSNLVMAMKEVFGSDFLNRPDLMQRFILVLNKSDTWLSGGEVTKTTFMSHLSSYVEGCGLVPVLVGASVDPRNGALRAARSDGHADFNAVVKEYHEANGREAEMYGDFFANIDLDEDLRKVLSRKFWGFKTLLRTVDSMVVQRDVENAQRISQRLLQIGDSTMQTIKDLERKHQILQGLNGKPIVSELKLVVKELLKNVSQIATVDFGTTAAIAASDVGQIKRYGNTARMEETEFAFGNRDNYIAPSSRYIGRMNPFKGYYDPDRVYIVSDYSNVLELSDETSEEWKHQIFSTVEDLTHSSNYGPGAISYLNTPLVGGALYDRAIAVWSASVYRFVAPSSDDLIRLANTLGIDPEMSDPNRFDFKKVKRLAEIYIYRLTPALHYLCQKVEFLLLKNFDTAWRTLLRTRRYKTLIEAVGENALKAEFKLHFQQAVRERAAAAYGKCFSDLHHEVYKIAPYSMDRPAVTGMLFAYPGIAEEILATKKRYHEAIQQEVRSIFPKDFSNAVLTGIETGISLLSDASSIDPLLFSGLHIVKTVLEPSMIGFPSRMKRGKINTPVLGAENLSEDRDERLLGLAACLYSHILPRLIATIDGRLRSDLWAVVKDQDLIEELELFLASSESVKLANRNAEECARRAQYLREKESNIRGAHVQLLAIGDKLPRPPPPAINNFDSNMYHEYSNMDDFHNSSHNRSNSPHSVTNNHNDRENREEFTSAQEEKESIGEEDTIVQSSYNYPYHNNRRHSSSSVLDFPGIQQHNLGRHEREGTLASDRYERESVSSVLSDPETGANESNPKAKKKKKFPGLNRKKDKSTISSLKSELGL